MLFGLKNADATYQCAMNAIFHKHICKIVECYVDDIAVKSRDKGDHLTDLKIVFDIMRAHQLKMNPKSFLGIVSGKFLRFVITSKEIHLDLEKICAIQEINLQEISKNSEIYRVRRFISNLSRRYQPFSRLMKKGVSFIWDNTCQEAFEEIKDYLTHPPILVALVSGKPFLLYA